MKKNSLFLFIISGVSGLLAVFLVARLFAPARENAGAAAHRGDVAKMGLTLTPNLPGASPTAAPSAVISTKRILRDEDVKSAVSALINDDMQLIKPSAGVPDIFVLDETTVPSNPTEQEAVNVKCYAVARSKENPQELDQRIYVLKLPVKRGTDSSWAIDLDGSPRVQRSFVIFRGYLAGAANSGNYPVQNGHDVSDLDLKNKSLEQKLMDRIRKNEPCPYFDDDSKWKEMISERSKPIKLVVEDAYGKPVKHESEQFQELIGKKTPVLVAFEIRQSIAGEHPPKLIIKLLE